MKIQKHTTRLPETGETIVKLTLPISMTVHIPHDGDLPLHLRAASKQLWCELYGEIHDRLLSIKGAAEYASQNPGLPESVKEVLHAVRQLNHYMEKSLSETIAQQNEGSEL